MTHNQFERIDCLGLYPPFLVKARLLIENCNKRGAVYFATSGGRGKKEQDDLYALGRTVKNPVGVTPKKPLGNIVTNAKFGQSGHSFFIAIDFTHDSDSNIVNGLQPDWVVANYKILAEEAVKLGLEAGLDWVTFPDAPHVQLFLSKHCIKMTDLAKAYDAGGYPAVFAILDKYQW